MKNQILNYIPKGSVIYVFEILNKENIEILIKKERKTKHGDFRVLKNEKCQITINSNLNPYRFLITLIHEIAHYKVYKTFGIKVKPHGKEWKNIFKYMMLPLLNPEIFPKVLIPYISSYIINPKASTDTDFELSLALRSFDTNKEKKYIYEIDKGCSFKIYNGRVFLLEEKLRKRYKCKEIASGKTYLFSPNAEIELV
tara:strand:- start:269 stop:862 length:594 start_codon:yes stop_codon:yes gene_type:complete